MIQGAIGTWRTVPKRGRTVARVTAHCTVAAHSTTELRSDGVCPACAAERVAGER